MSTLKKLWNNKKAAAPLQKRRTPESKCSLQQEVIFSQEWVHKKCLSWLCRRPTGMFPNFQLRLRTPHCWKAEYNFLKTGNGNIIIGRVYDWQLQNARCQCVGTIATLNTAFAPNLENVGEPPHYFFNPYSSFIRTTRVINHSNFNSSKPTLVQQELIPKVASLCSVCSFQRFCVVNELTQECFTTYFVFV